MNLSTMGFAHVPPQLTLYHRICQRHPKVLTVTSVVRRQPGGSQSCLVQCDDGKLYVLKMHPNPQGPNVLANELLGSILLNSLGFPTPGWRFIKLDLNAVRFFPELAMETVGMPPAYPACGLHFGSEYLGGPHHHLFDILPKSCTPLLRSREQFLPIYLFDVWASHQDDRQSIYQKAREASVYEVFFIDNGHLFGGPRWSDVAGYSRTAPSVHIQSPRVGDPGVEQWITCFEARIPALLYQAIKQVPAEWYGDNIYALYTRLMWRLEFIRLLVAGDILRRDQGPLLERDS